jgi:hypothetical protein
MKPINKMLRMWLTISREEMFKRWSDHLVRTVMMAKDRLKIKKPLLWMTAKTAERRIKVMKRSARVVSRRAPSRKGRRTNHKIREMRRKKNLPMGILMIGILNGWGISKSSSYLVASYE